MPITHAKVTLLPSLTQGELDDAIAAGQYPSGTTLDDIVSNVDWNAQHVFDLAIADITGLQIALTALSNDIAGKANASHSHVISQITGLQDALDALTASLSGKANTSHTHAITDITGLSTQLSTITSSINTLTTEINAVETTANSALQPSAIANMLETSDIGSSVQGFDADTAKIDVVQSWVAQGQRIGTTENGGLTIASNVITLNLGAYNAFDLGTLAAGAYTLANPTGLAANVSYKGDIGFNTPASGSVTFAFGANWATLNNIAPSIPTVNNRRVVFEYATQGTGGVRLSSPNVWGA